MERTQWARWDELDRDRNELEKLIARYEDDLDPLRMLIVTNKLLTGFDAPAESVMYLDNPLKEHNLLQAIARTNRVEGKDKTNWVELTMNDSGSGIKQENISNIFDPFYSTKDTGTGLGLAIVNRIIG